MFFGIVVLLILFRGLMMGLSCSLGSMCVCVHVGVAVLSVAAHQDHMWLGYSVF
jgi:hypothetical protein